MSREYDAWRDVNGVPDAHDELRLLRDVEAGHVEEIAGLRQRIDSLGERNATLETACREAMRKADDHRRQRDEARDDCKAVEDRAEFLHGQLQKAQAEVERLKSPAVVMAECERLLREACSRSGYVEVQIHGGLVAISDRYDGEPLTERQTLAEAYAKLTGGRDG